MRNRHNSCIEGSRVYHTPVMEQAVEPLNIDGESAGEMTVEGVSPLIVARLELLQAIAQAQNPAEAVELETDLVLVDAAIAEGRGVEGEASGRPDAQQALAARALAVSR